MLIQVGEDYFPKKVADYVLFNKDKYILINQLSNYFGDAGVDINSMFLEGRTAKEIMELLPENRKNNFKKFLDCTIEGKYLAGLDAAQVKALAIYSSSHYKKINDALREIGVNGNITDLPDIKIEGIPLQKIVSDLDSALSSYSKFSTKMVLYRGVNMTSFIKSNKSILEEYQKYNEVSDLEVIYKTLQKAIGKVICDPGYISASPGYETSYAKNRPIALEIIADENVKGAYINQVSQYYNAENEFLFARNTKLIIVDVALLKKDGQDRVVVRCIAKS